MKEDTQENKDPAPRPNGRPTLYTPELAAEICSQLASGMSLRKISKIQGMPSLPSIFLWLGKYKEFSEQYAKAREQQAEAMFEEIFEIADDGRGDTYIDDNGMEKTDTDVLGRSRLRVDVRKWALSKMLPRKYGDKVDHQHTGPNGGPIDHSITVSFVKQS